MPTKMRLQRHGKKASAFYHIVIADNRAPRDGKFIEKIGTYNPNTNPATIDLEFEKALNWFKTGAEPTNTVRAILSYEGVLYKNHLDKGVLKGALSEADADKRFDSWKQEKTAKIQGKIEHVAKTRSEREKAMLKAEEEVNKKREQEILSKQSAMADEAKKATAAEVAVAEAPAAEEAPAIEAVADEAPAAEATPAEEPKAEEGTEEKA